MIKAETSAPRRDGPGCASWKTAKAPRPQPIGTEMLRPRGQTCRGTARGTSWRRNAHRCVGRAAPRQRVHGLQPRTRVWTKRRPLSQRNRRTDSPSPPASRTNRWPAPRRLLRGDEEARRMTRLLAELSVAPSSRENGRRSWPGLSRRRPRVRFRRRGSQTRWPAHRGGDPRALRRHLDQRQLSAARDETYAEIVRWRSIVPLNADERAHVHDRRKRGFRLPARFAHGRRDEQRERDRPRPDCPAVRRKGDRERGTTPRLAGLMATRRTLSPHRASRALPSRSRRRRPTRRPSRR